MTLILPIAEGPIVHQYIRGFFLFGVRLIRIKALIENKVKVLNKDGLHMFSKIMI